MTRSTPAARGVDWLTADRPVAAVFTPERLSDEHRLIRQTATEFVTNEVMPALPDLEKKDWARVRALVRRAGDLGLNGTDVPDALGGVGLDKAASIVVTEAIGAVSSFATTFGAQSGLAMIPLLCFGTPEQQARYLPRLTAGDLIGAYCLSESGSGSDALGARARATRAADGSWRLNGEKMWTTNGGFADLFIVFAKVDGEQFSAFLVERGFPGVSTGSEEHKMGLHGSSTTPLVLANAEVPAANLLGEVGQGHKIAFNVLNYGRFKLAAMCTGGARAALADSIAYAGTRRQFGRPIASFGAIRQKIAAMTSRLYAVESMLYRTAGLLDEAIGTHADDPATIARALEEFAIESSLLKIAGSEMIGFVVDENVQIHGGNGFVRDYAAERHYRDARVDRIFEGTNEINRLLVPSMILKRSAKGALPAITAGGSWHEAPMSSTSSGLGSSGSSGSLDSLSNGPLTGAARTVSSLKHAAIATLRRAVDRHGDRLADEQEVVMLTCDVILAAFAADSVLRRAEDAITHDPSRARLHADIAAIGIHRAGLDADAAVRTAVSALTDGPVRDRALADLARSFVVDPFDVVAAGRRVADAAMDARRYPFA